MTTRDANTSDGGLEFLPVAFTALLVLGCNVPGYAGVASDVVRRTHQGSRRRGVTRAFPSPRRGGRVNLLTLALLGLLAFPFTLGTNDPGHDTLYVALLGDSNVTGNISVSAKLNATYIQATSLFYADYLDVRANGTIETVASRPAIQADSQNLYLDSTLSTYLNTRGGTSGIIQMGSPITNGITLNVSGTIRQQNIPVCLSDGTNCPGSLGGTNVTGTGSPDALAKWTSASGLATSRITDDGTTAIALNNQIYLNTTSGNVGIGTSSPGNKLEVVGTMNASAIKVGATSVCLADGTNCPVAASETDPLWRGNASFVANQSYVTSLGNWSAERSQYVNTTVGDTRYVRNTSVPTCTGAQYLTAAANGVLSCTTPADANSGGTLLRAGSPNNSIQVVQNTTDLNLTVNTTYLDTLFYLDSNPSSYITASGELDRLWTANLSTVCRTNGTNCPGTTTGANVTGTGSTNQLAYWANGTNLAALSAGTTTQVLHGNAGGSPTWAALNLANDVTGTLAAAAVGNGLTDTQVNDAITVSGGTLGSNTISSGTTWSTAGTLTIGDGGDRIDVNSDTWDVTNGAVGGVTTLTTTSTIHANKNHYAVLSYANAGTPANGYLITTNIPFQDGAEMPYLEIEGYPYGSSVPMKLNLVWYVYSGAFTNYAYTNLGGWDPGTVSLSNNSGYVTIHLSTSTYYTRFSIRAYENMGSTDSWFEGWSVSDATAPPGNKVTVSRAPLITSITGTAGTATALAADPADCGSNTWATSIGASGALTCSAVTYAGITATTSSNWASVVSDETGTGSWVFNNTPTIASPTITGSGSVTASTGAFTTLTRGGQNVCTSDGTNCPAVSGSSSAAGWTNTSTTTSTSLDVNVASGKLFVNSTSGNVGIGTAGPGYTLQVSGTFGAGASTFGSYATVSSYLDVGGLLYTRSNMLLLNKAGDGWVTYATRNTAGTESVYDLANIGTISSGAITATSFSGAGTGLTGTASSLTAGNSNQLGSQASTYFLNISGFSAANLTSGTIPQARIPDQSSLHTHDASNITSGTLAVARGGTGVTASSGSGSYFLLNNSPVITSPTITGPTLSGTVTGGTFSGGTWQGTAIGDSYISSASTWSAKSAAGASSVCPYGIANVTLSSSGVPSVTCAAQQGTGSMSSFTLAGTSGSSQTISNGDALTIAAGSAITTTAGATDTVTVAVAADSIGDTQLAYNTGQHLTTSSSPTFAGLTRGSVVYQSITRTLTQTQNDWVDIGNVSNNGVANYATFYVYTHSCGAIVSETFRYDTTAYVGGSTNWLELPLQDNQLYSSTQWIAIDVRNQNRSSTSQPTEVRLRTKNGFCSSATVYVDIESNAVLTASAASGSNGTVDSGYLGNDQWNFPAGSTWTATTQGLFIRNSGNVGIGTTSPAQKLDVNGSLNVSGQNAQAWVNGSIVCTVANGHCAATGANATGSGTQHYLARWTNATNLDTSLVYDSGSSIGIGTTTPTAMLTLNSSNGAGSLLVLNTTGSTHLFVNGSTGMVGIGKRNPAYKLDVVGGINSNVGISVNSGSTLGNTGDLIVAPGDGAGVIRIQGGVTNQGYVSFNDSGQYLALSVQSYTNNNLVLKNGGNVGINTSTPGSTLEVVGTINATAIKVGNTSVLTSAVTNMATGSFLTGGPITTTGTIALDSAALVANIGNWSSDKSSYSTTSTGDSRWLGISATATNSNQLNSQASTYYWNTSTSLITTGSELDRLWTGNLSTVCRTNGTNCQAAPAETDPVWNGNKTLVCYANGTNCLAINGAASAAGWTNTSTTTSTSLGMSVYNASNTSQVFLTVNTTTGSVGLGTANPVSPVQVAGQLNMSANRIVNVAAPTASSDAATKAYVDALVGSDRPGNWTCTVRSAWSGNSFSDATASCTGSEKVINGGCNCGSGTITTSLPTGQGWACACSQNNIYAYANCCT